MQNRTVDPERPSALRADPRWRRLPHLPAGRRLVASCPGPVPLDGAEITVPATAVAADARRNCSRCARSCPSAARWVCVTVTPCPDGKELRQSGLRTFAAVESGVPAGVRTARLVAATADDTVLHARSFAWLLCDRVRRDSGAGLARQYRPRQLPAASSPRGHSRPMLGIFIWTSRVRGAIRRFHLRAGAAAGDHSRSGGTLPSSRLYRLS